jgi:hypothetical protein
LNSGKIEANLQDIKKENSYFSKPLETMPPIVVKDNQIEDGNHRYRVCKRKNVKTILIYDVINIENE